MIARATNQSPGQQGTIAFSHANGFPAGTYRLLFEAWRAAGYRVIAVDKFGHHAAYPVNRGWTLMRDELIQLIEQQAPGEAVHLVGHSLGGYLSLRAACKRPDLALSVVLLDSPLVAGWRAQSLRAMKLSGLMARFSPGRVSARRRWQWPSDDAALQHFAGKTAFARWQPDVLRDYIRSGTETDPEATAAGGVRLAFKRDIETQLYNSLPHDTARLLRRHPLRCPVAYIAGTQSQEGRLAGLSYTRAIAGDHWACVEGSHLFPMEKPLATAQAVLHLLAGTALANAPAGAAQAHAHAQLRGDPDRRANTSR